MKILTKITLEDKNELAGIREVFPKKLTSESFHNDKSIFAFSSVFFFTRTNGGKMETSSRKTQCPVSKILQRYIKVISLFCTAHPLLRITLLHPRRRRFFPLARKEQTRAAFAELKLLFAIIMPQIGWQQPVLLSKNKKMKEMCVIPKSAVVFHFAAVEELLKCPGWGFGLWGAVRPVGQLHGSPTALTSQYLSWDRYCTYVVQTPRVERRIFLEK